MNNKLWLFIAALLYSGGLGLGLVTPASIANLLFEDNAALKELADTLALLPQSSVVVVIFIKNVSALLISFVLSPIFCLIPVIALIVNGWLLGAVAVTVIQEKSLIYLLAGVVPHGIFELPAFIIGEAVALSFGTAVVLAVFIEKRRSLLLSNLKHSLRYLVVAFILLLPAAIIETYVTPLFLR
ncbi:MAG: stage II sporulation protein M [Chloroflexota bacterium]